MEPTIYKPSIYKGAGIYKTGAEGGGGFEIGSLIATAQNKNSTYCFFLTPVIPLDTASLIEENISCKAFSFSSDGNNYHDCGGQWWTNGSVFYGVSPYIYANKIQLHYGNGLIDIFNGIDNNFSNVINRNIVYDKLNNKAIITIKYNDVVVLSHEMPLDNVLLHDTNFYVGGRRNFSSTSYVFNGEIDLAKTYFKIDGDLFWGVK